MATAEVKKETETDLSRLTGNEKSLTYKVIPAPANTGRFSFGWDKYKTKFGKLIFINILMLICFIPVFVLVYLRQYRLAYEGMNGVFGDNLGIGYPAAPDMTGLAENLILRVDMLFCALAILASFFTAAGISGGLYCTRKLLRSEEELKFKDFFIGIKKGYFVALAASVIVFTVFFAAMYIWDFAGYRMAMGESAGMWITFRVLGWIAFALASLISLWILAVGTNYRQNAWGLIKNSLRLCFGSILQSFLFAVLFCLPVLLIFIPAFGTMLAYLWFILAGFSTALFIWGAFNDWLFDYALGYTAKQVEVQTQAEESASAPKMNKEDIMNLLLVGTKSAYLSRAVEPLNSGTNAYVLPENFTAEDLSLAAKRRLQIEEESRVYAAAHENEEKYVEYNARFRDREKALNVTDKKGKKKKFAPKMLNQ